MGYDISSHFVFFKLLAHWKVICSASCWLPFLPQLQKNPYSQLGDWGASGQIQRTNLQHETSTLITSPLRPYTNKSCYPLNSSFPIPCYISKSSLFCCYDHCIILLCLIIFYRFFSCSCQIFHNKYIYFLSISLLMPIFCNSSISTLCTEWYSFFIFFCYIYS